MRDDLLLILQKNACTVSAIPDDDILLFECQRLVDRILTIGSRLLDPSLGVSDFVYGWIRQLSSTSNSMALRQRIESMRIEIDKLLETRTETIMDYLFSSLGELEGGKIEQLVEVLQNSANRAIPLSRDPPWEIKSEKFSPLNESIIAILDTTLEPTSTEIMLHKLKRRFEHIVYMQLPRPKVWILPTITKRRIVVALGLPEVLDLLLRTLKSS